MAVDSERAGRRWLQRSEFYGYRHGHAPAFALYLLVFGVDACSSLLGIACCVAGYYLLLSLR